MEIKRVINRLAPNAKCGGPGPSSEEDWNNWRWDDERPKPTWAEVQAAWAEIVESDEYLEEQAEAELDEKLTRIPPTNRQLLLIWRQFKKMQNDGIVTMLPKVNAMCNRVLGEVDNG